MNMLFKLYRSTNLGEDHQPPSAMRRKRANATAGAKDATAAEATTTATGTTEEVVGTVPANETHAESSSVRHDYADAEELSDLAPLTSRTVTSGKSSSASSPTLVAQRGRSISGHVALLAAIADHDRDNVSCTTNTESDVLDTEDIMDALRESDDDDDSDVESGDQRSIRITARERARAKSRLSWDSNGRSPVDVGSMHLTSPMRLLMQMQEQKKKKQPTNQHQETTAAAQAPTPPSSSQKGGDKFVKKKMKAAKKLLNNLRLSPQKGRSPAFQPQEIPLHDIPEEKIFLDVQHSQHETRKRNSSDVSLMLKAEQRRSAGQAELFLDERFSPLGKFPSTGRIQSTSIEDIGRKLAMFSSSAEASPGAVTSETSDVDAMKETGPVDPAQHSIFPTIAIEKQNDHTSIDSSSSSITESIAKENKKKKTESHQFNAAVLRRIISSSNSNSYEEKDSPHVESPDVKGNGEYEKRRRSKSRRQSLKVLLTHFRGNSGAKDAAAFYEAVKANDVKRVRKMIYSDVGPASSRRRKSSQMTSQILLDDSDKALPNLFCTAEIDWKNTNEQNKSALHVCAENGYTQMMALLLECGARVNTEDKLQRTPLHLCSSAGHHSCAILLCSQSALVNARDSYGFSPLYLAMKNHHFDVALDLMVFGADINFKTLGGTTFLHEVMKRNDVEAANFIVSKSDHHFCLVNAKDEKGDPPLFKAIQAGHTEVIDAMMGLNSMGTGKPRFTITARNSAGCNVFHVAAAAGQATMIRYLVQKASAFGCTLGQLSIMLSEKDKRYRYTPLHWAVKENQFATVKELLWLSSSSDEKMNLHALRRTGKSAITPSGGGNNNAFVGLLSKMLGGRSGGNSGGAILQPANVLNIDVNAQDEQLNTPIHLALKRSKTLPEIITLLLSYPRVRIDIKNKEGESVKNLCKRQSISLSSLRSEEEFNRRISESEHCGDSNGESDQGNDNHGNGSPNP